MAGLCELLISVGNRREPIVPEPTKQYKPGEKVRESGEYVCEICHTEGGVETHGFAEGEDFTECPNCGRSTTWRKAPSE